MNLVAYPPDFLPILDPRKVPLYLLADMASYEVLGGWTLSQYHAVGPIADLREVCIRRSRVWNVGLQLLVAKDVQLAMRRQVLDATLRCEPRH